MLSYNPHSYRCCQHNVAHGWPYYAEHLWMATPDNGLAAVLYAASEVTAKVGQGQRGHDPQHRRSIPLKTRSGMTISTADAVANSRFICACPDGVKTPIEVKINGKKIKVHARPQSFIVIDRKWKQGDKIDLTLPMTIGLRYWPRNGDSVSVDRGPADVLAEDRREVHPLRRHGRNGPPGTSIPTTAVELRSRHRPGQTRRIPVQGQSQRKWPQDDQPFVTTAAPDRDHRRRQGKIPNWQADHRGLIDEVQQSPVQVGRANRDRDTDSRWAVRPAAHQRLPLDRGRAPRRPNGNCRRVHPKRARFPSKASHCNDGRYPRRAE